MLTEINLRVFFFVDRTTLKATVILLPLLGLTWVFGILTIDHNTTVFAWLFTIFNSIQVCYECAVAVQLDRLQQQLSLLLKPNQLAKKTKMKTLNLSISNNKLFSH